MNRYYKMLAAAAAATFMAVAGPVSAEYPDKPVTFLVPWPPGDLEDILTRMIAEDFQEEYGVSAAVLNVPGGGGGPMPGAIQVAESPSDGSVIGSFVIGVPTLGHEVGIPELAPEKFDPIGIFLTYPFVIATSGDAPYQSMAELTEHAKSNEVVLGHFGSVLAPTQVTMAFAKSAGFEWGSDSAFDMLDCNTLASGDADVINTTLQLILPCLEDITVLASITDTRISLTPDAPTIGELDPSLNLALWNGLFVTKDTSAEVRAKIAAVAEKTVLSERAQKVAEETGALVYWQDADASAARVKADIETLATINALLN